MGIQVPPDDTGKVVETFQPVTDHRQIIHNGDLVSSGTITGASQTVSLDVVGHSAVAVQITGTWTADLEFEVTVDGSNWVADYLRDVDGVCVTQLTPNQAANGVYWASTGGANSVRLRSSAYTSGTATISFEGVSASGKEGLAARRDNVAFTEGVDRVVPMGAFYDTAPGAPTSGNVGVPVMNSSRQLEVDVQASALPTGAATAANQLPDGHNVTVDNASGGSAVNIQDGGNSITVDGTVTADAGTGPWPVTDNAGSLTVDTVADATDGSAHGASQTGFRAMGTDGTNDQQIAVDATGNVQVDIVADAAGLATAANQLPDGHNVTVDNAAGASAVNIQDGGNVITVDGTVTADAGTGPWPVTDNGGSLTVDTTADATDGAAHGASQTGFRAMGTDGTNDQQIAVDATGNVQIDIVSDAAGLATSAGQLPDGHNVTVDNASGASAVNIQDGGNSITVDGTVTADAGTGPWPVTDNGGSLTVDFSGQATDGSAHGGTPTGVRMMVSDSTNDQYAQGDPTGRVRIVGAVDADGVAAGSPVRTGFVAKQFAAAPTTVSADGDVVASIGTAQGIQFVLGGHPNIISREFMSNDGETDTDMLGAVAAGSHVVVTGIEVLNDNSTTATVQVRVGFGATTVPSEPATGAGVNGVVLTHPGLAPGSGVVRGNGSGILAVGGDGEELRVTCGAPTGGQLSFLITYYVATL